MSQREEAMAFVLRVASIADCLRAIRDLTTTALVYGDKPKMRIERLRTIHELAEGAMAKVDEVIAYESRPIEGPITDPGRPGRTAATGQVR
jgi:hypothetical protein